MTELNSFREDVTLEKDKNTLNNLWTVPLKCLLFLEQYVFIEYIPAPSLIKYFTATLKLYKMTKYINKHFLSKVLQESKTKTTFILYRLSWTHYF